MSSITKSILDADPRVQTGVQTALTLLVITTAAWAIEFVFFRDRRVRDIIGVSDQTSLKQAQKRYVTNARDFITEGIRKVRGPPQPASRRVC